MMSSHGSRTTAHPVVFVIQRPPPPTAETTTAEDSNDGHTLYEHIPWSEIIAQLIQDPREQQVAHILSRTLSWHQTATLCMMSSLRDVTVELQLIHPKRRIGLQPLLDNAHSSSAERGGGDAIQRIRIPLADIEDVRWEHPTMLVLQAEKHLASTQHDATLWDHIADAVAQTWGVGDVAGNPLSALRVTLRCKHRVWQKFAAATTQSSNHKLLTGYDPCNFVVLYARTVKEAKMLRSWLKSPASVVAAELPPASLVATGTLEAAPQPAASPIPSTRLEAGGEVTELPAQRVSWDSVVWSHQRRISVPQSTASVISGNSREEADVNPDALLRAQWEIARGAKPSSLARRLVEHARRRFPGAFQIQPWTMHAHTEPEAFCSFLHETSMWQSAAANGTLWHVLGEPYLIHAVGQQLREDRLSHLCDLDGVDRRPSYTTDENRFDRPHAWNDASPWITLHCMSLNPERNHAMQWEVLWRLASLQLDGDVNVPELASHVDRRCHYLTPEEYEEYSGGKYAEVKQSLDDVLDTIQVRLKALLHS